MPSISKRRLCKIVDTIESSSTISCRGFDSALRWIRLIAESDNNMELFAQLVTRQQLRDGKECKDPSLSAQTNVDERRTKVDISRKFIRFYSENFAVIDFLHCSMNESQYGRWEWPVWVGQISVSVNVDATVTKTMTHVIVVAPIEFPNPIPGTSLLYRNRTPTTSFRCEPMNLFPVPPWGRLRGLTSDDEDSLKSIALDLENAGERQVAVPIHSQEMDPLNIRILCKKHARERFERAPRFGRYVSNTWLLYDEHAQTNNGMDNSDTLLDSSSPLVCCWVNDAFDDCEVTPRAYIEYIILLMKTRDRLVRESRSRIWRLLR
jgi:hypothetical protein